jgi:predicted metal-dependent phosphoesterase TrpH
MVLRVDFHVHTVFSPDSLLSPPKAVEIARRRGLDRLVITDHNTLAGARLAHALDPQRVIIGEEIRTSEGELLAVYVREEVPPGLSPLETIHRLRQQGAFISVSHPLDARRGWRLECLREIAPLVDAIEIFNARCLLPSFNRQAAEFARQYGLPGTVGSDAHAAFEVGRAVFLLPPFNGAEELRRVIRQGKMLTRPAPLPWALLASRYAWLRKKLMPRRTDEAS